MFEKIAAPRTARAPWLHSWAIPASVAAHALLAAGLVAVPLHAGRGPEMEEVVTYLVFPTPSPDPDPVKTDAVPARQAATPAPPAPRPADTEVEGDGAASAAAEEEALPSEVGPALASPREAADALPRLAPTVAVAAGGLGGGDADALASALVRAMLPAREGAPGEAVVVAADELAEPPRMVNRRELSRTLSRDYPRALQFRGVVGELLVAFIIGTDGRVERESVRIISSTHPAFVEPTIRGLARMRFRPARLGGAPVRVRTTIPVRWTLPDA